MNRAQRLRRTVRFAFWAPVTVGAFVWIGYSLVNWWA